MASEFSAIQTPLRVAAIGLGWVTQHRHLPTMEESSEFDIIGVIDKRAGRAQELARRRRYPQNHQGDDLTRVPWLDRVDAITIGASPSAHYPLIKSALMLDKHVLTEKPFTLKITEAEELVELAQTKRKILAIVHNFQFARSTRAMLKDVQSGAFGRITGVVAGQLGNPARRLPEWYEELPLGLFYDESPHLMYLMRRFAPGPMQLVSCSVFPSTIGEQTPAVVQALYGSNPGDGTAAIPIQLTCNFNSPLSEWHLMVLGERFLGIVDIFRDIYVRLPNDEQHTARTITRTSWLSTLQHWSQVIPNGVRHIMGRMRYGNEIVFHRFAEAVRTGIPPSGISAADALEVLRMQHAIIQHPPVCGNNAILQRRIPCTR